MDFIEKQIPILLKNGFKYNTEETKLKNKGVYITIGPENFMLNIYGDTELYQYWHLNEKFTDLGLKNLIFFSNLEDNDKNWFRKKLDPGYNTSHRINIIDDVLNLNDNIEKIEKSIHYTEIAKNSFLKRKQLYESFCNEYVE